MENMEKMGKFTINDWFTIQTRKDLTYIRKSLKHQSVNWAIFADVFIALFSFCLDRTIWDPSQPNATPSWFWILIAILLVIIPACIFCFAYFRQKRITRDRNIALSPEGLVNLFDNEICYNVMIADTMLDHMKSIPDYSEIKKFYFIEASYYVNKASSQLLQFRIPAKKVITNEPTSESNGIDILRFVNVCNLVTSIYGALIQFASNNEDYCELTSHNKAKAQAYNYLVNHLTLLPNDKPELASLATLQPVALSNPNTPETPESSDDLPQE